MNTTAWLVAGSSFSIALLAPFLLISLLERVGAVDVPNSRSSHAHRALRGGGLAQALGIGCSLVLALALSVHPRSLLMVGLGVLVATALLGWIEDVAGLSVLSRASGQFTVGLVAAAIVAAELDRTPLWCLVGGVAVLGLVNIVNFMDGVNAMSAAHAIIAGITFVILGSLEDTDWLVIFGAVFAGAFLAFLPWNINGRLFLGDTGSYLSGGFAAITIVMAWMDELPLIALAAPFVIYVADTAVTLVSRVRAGERWHEAHRDHTYQRLNRSGLSHLAVSGIVAGASCSTAALGIVFSQTDGGLRIVAVSAIILIAASYTALRFVINDLPDPSRKGPA